MGVSLGMQLALFAVMAAVMLLALALNLPILTHDAGRVMNAALLLLAAAAAAGAASINRVYTFRSSAPWWIAALAMAGVSLLWNLGESALSTHLCRALQRAYLPGWVEVEAALWLMAQYLMQRFVLFPKTMDTR